MSWIRKIAQQVVYSWITNNRGLGLREVLGAHGVGAFLETLEYFGYKGSLDYNTKYVIQ